MAAIRSLLNPAPEPDKTSDSEFEPPQCAKQDETDYSPSQQVRKKQKICKDAAVFVAGPIRGECRYPPHETKDEMLKAHHQRFGVFPIGNIAEYPRHIPYNSEKKSLSGKTGRESLEVFQYNFRIPGDDTQYAMLWDYNIGLVRTTPLFKCTGHSKTTPAKMLNRNPGLRNICHSITGGALVAQGYWMPYEAARAVAATFCWNIRFALTPVFGKGFPAMCYPPDSESFGDMVIDPAITKRCTEQADAYRKMEDLSIPQSSSNIVTPLTPDTPTFPRQVKPPRPKMIKPNKSAYLSDVGSEGSYSPCPTTPDQGHSNIWTSVNTPRSVPDHRPNNQVSPRKRSSRFKRYHGFQSPELSPKSRPVAEVDEAYDGDSSDDSAINDVAEAARKWSIGLPSDEKAAYLLMSLKLHNTTQQASRGTKRRAST